LFVLPNKILVAIELSFTINYSEKN